MNQKQKDLILGNMKEDYIVDVIKTHFNLNTLTKLSTYNPFDFYNKENDIYFELKARRVKHNTYKTTMIGLNKYLEAQKLKTVYFIFSFEDGDYYYKYNKDDKFEIAIGGRCDRNKAEYKDYVYIPITKLIKI
jgi:hypothetical protein